MKKKQDEYTQRQLQWIGQRLRELRKAKGYANYEQFAFQHDIHRVQYGRYEKGEDMRVSSLLKVLKALEVTPEEFWRGFEP